MEGASNESLVERFFEEIYWSKRDKRLDGFPLMSVWPIIFINVWYIILAFFVGPNFMKDRQAFKMEIFGALYNAVQFFAEFSNLLWIVVYYFAAGSGWGKAKVSFEWEMFFDDFILL